MYYWSNHKTVAVERDLWRSWNSTPNSSSPQQGHRKASRWVLSVCEREHTTAEGNQIQCSITLTVKLFQLVPPVLSLGTSGKSLPCPPDTQPADTYKHPWVSLSGFSYLCSSSANSRNQSLDFVMTRIPEHLNIIANFDILMRTSEHLAPFHSF